MKRVSHSVAHFVTVGAQDPCGVVALAATVLGDWLQSSLVGVSSENAVDLSLTVLNFFIDSVTCFVVLQDALSVVNPAVFVTHLIGSGGRDGLLSILGKVWLNIEWEFTLLFTFADAVTTNWHKLSAVMDSSDLGSQEVLLSVEVEWVCHNLSFQVA